MNRSDPNPINQIAQFAAGVAQSSIPVPLTVAESCRELMLNAAGAALAGAAHPEGVALARVVREMGGNGRSTIIGMGMRTSPVYASLVNGTLVRLLDFDDNTVDSGAHCTAAVFPAVMALGEMHGYSGHAVLDAFAVGCEVAARLGALDQRCGSGGAVGAAVASSILLGLDAEGVARAVGLAVDSASGGIEYGSAGAAAIAEGRAAMQGVICALSAAEGVGGVPRDVGRLSRDSCRLGRVLALDRPRDNYSPLPLRPRRP